MEKVKANHEFWFKLAPIHQGIVFTSSCLDSIITLSNVRWYTWCWLVLALYKYFLLGTAYNSISANLSRSLNYINYKSCAVVFDLFIALDLSHHWDLFYILTYQKIVFSFVNIATQLSTWNFVWNSICHGTTRRQLYILSDLSLAHSAVLNRTCNQISVCP